MDTMRPPKYCKKIAYPLSEKEAKLERTIAKEYECPVCFNYAAPPIMMCSNSHVICYDCWKRCINCPTCRVEKSLTRAHALEKIHPLIGFPCKWEGCTYIASSSCTSIHEQRCRKFPIKCPFGKNHECRWKGTMEGAKAHLLTEHRANTCLIPNVLMMSKGFAQATKRSYTIVFAVYDRLFKLHWHFNTNESTKVKFGMVSLGNGNPIMIYNYSLTFAKQFPITHCCRKLKIIKAQVKKEALDEDRNDHFSHEHEYQELLAFCNGGDLHYQVIIDVGQFVRSRGRI